MPQKPRTIIITHGHGRSGFQGYVSACVYICFLRYGDRVHYGRVNSDIVKKEIPPSDSGQSFVMVCGTKSFVDDMTSYLTLAAGYTHDNIHVF